MKKILIIKMYYSRLRLIRHCNPIFRRIFDYDENSQRPSKLHIHLFSRNQLQCCCIKMIIASLLKIIEHDDDIIKARTGPRMLGDSCISKDQKTSM